MVKVTILELKEEAGSIVEKLSELGVSVKDLFRSLNSKGSFTFYLDKKDYQDLLPLLEKECVFQASIEDTKEVSPWGFFSTAMLDTFLVFHTSQWLVEGLKVKDFLNLYISNPTLLWSIESILKLAFAYAFYRGFVENLLTTPFGYLFKLKLRQDSQVGLFTTIYLLPFASLLLISSPFTLYLKLLGLFLFGFFVASLFQNFFKERYGLLLTAGNT
ncbi:hypothetical protein [Thermocrinis minervae]|uniref:Uncharacterized protein n=1 Tax=Thermocrinis minervae TaxID=381751 RepID=A0A1M6R3E8_9AQUI|nr:hypothetical protein [Thermocrinis minervae]SHK26946.1 hypothetical protein SAMN05444391_0499 [Thermocrinis minervae]